MSSRKDPAQGSGSSPIGGQMAQVVLGLAARARLPALERRYDSVAVLGVFALVNGCLSIGLMAAAAWLTRQPLVFPSLGPTAFLLFYTPTAASACPRNTLIGHLVALLVGYGSLVLFGLRHAEHVLQVGVTGPRVGAAAASLGVTAAVMVWLRAAHPPAGASTLIVSLGFVTAAASLAVMMVAVVLLLCQAVVINRLAGVAYPLWSPRPNPGGPATG